MKILHTSDWHLGQVFYGYDRREEQQAFLEALAEVVGRERPDVMIVSGDVFHNSTPSAQAKRMYVEGMMRIHEACPTMTVVVIAGNHDSPSRRDGLFRETGGQDGRFLRTCRGCGEGRICDRACRCSSLCLVEEFP